MTFVLDPVSVISASGASQTLTASPGNPIFDITENTNGCAYTLAGGTAQAGRLQRVRLVRRQDATGGRVCVLPTNVLYPKGNPPIVSSSVGSFDFFDFVTLDGGATWFVENYGVGLLQQLITLGSLTAGPYYAGNAMTLGGGYTGPAPTSVDYSIDGGAWSTATTSFIAIGAYQVGITLPGGLSVGAHTMQVRETNATGIVSSQVSFTTSAATAPSQPGLGASPLNNAVALTMSSVNANGAAITFDIYRTAAGGAAGSETLLTSVAAGAANSATYTDSTAANGSAYRYYVIARNTAGSSTQSTETIALTPSALPLHYFVPNSSGATAGQGAVAARNVTTDAATNVIDARIWVALSTYTPTATSFVIGKYDVLSAGASSEWSLQLGATAGIYFDSYDNQGGATNRRTGSATTDGGTTYAAITSAANYSASNGVWLRAIANYSQAPYTSSDGITVASGKIMFFTGLADGSQFGSNYTQLGVTQTGSTAGIAQFGTASVGINIAKYQNSTQIAGKVYRSLVVDANNRVLTDADFTGLPTTAAGGTFNDLAGRVNIATTPNVFTLSAGSVA